MSFRTLTQGGRAVWNGVPSLGAIVSWALICIALCSPANAVESANAALESLPTGPGSNSSELLAPEERRWLDAHPDIVLGSSVDSYPILIQDADGAYSGMLPDYVAALNERLGTHITLATGLWPEIVARAERREIDGIGLVMALDKWRDHFLFSRPLFSTYFNIYARSDDRKRYRTVADLWGRRVGYVSGMVAVETLLRRNPDIEGVAFPDYESVARALLEGRVDAVIAPLLLEHWRRRNVETGFQLNAPIPETRAEVVFVVRKDWPELVSILNKGLDAIDAKAKRAILARFMVDAVFPANGLASEGLSSEEKEWLEDHPIIHVGIDPAWAPVEFFDDAGNAQGISLEYLKRLEESLNLTLYLQKGLNWSEAHDDLEQGALDLLPALVETPARKQRLLFTKPYLSLPVAIFSAQDVAYLGDIDALAGKRVAVVRDYAVEAWLKRDYPDLELLPTDNVEQALRQVAKGEAYAYVGNLVTTSYYIGQTGLTQIKVAGETPYRYQLAMAVPGDRPLLRSILQKGLDAIPESERSAIYNQWISIAYTHSFDYRLMWQILAIGGVILLIILYWNRRLAAEIQARRRVEAQLRESKAAAERARLEAEQANRSKSTFLASMSHELRTPLNAVLGFSSLLLETAPSARNRNYLNSIRSAGKSLLQLIDDILELSRIEAQRIELHPTPLDLRRLFRELHDLFAPMAAGKDLTLELTIAPALPTVLLLDEVRLRQVLVNLIGNALKFTEQGRIGVRASGQPMEHGVLTLEIAVEDSGQGIPKEQQQAIFDLFTQRSGQDVARYGGSGLGLAISRRLAGLMGGEILLRSELGRGSTFTLVLAGVSVDCALPTTRRLEPLDASLSFAPATILVVDDAPLNRGLILDFLRPYRFQLLEAEDGEQAIEIAVRHHPDLILMDLLMPGIDGLEACRRIKAKPATAAVPIIAVTASPISEVAQQARELCDGLLSKPLSKEALLHALLPFLEHRHETPGSVTEPAPTTPSPRPPDKLGALSLPSDLTERLEEMDPSTCSINRIQDVATQLIQAGEQQRDDALTEAGQYLLGRLREFDLPGMRSCIETLRRLSHGGR